MVVRERIVTLLPSATEIVCALGLSHRLVGVTHECDFPSSVTRLPKVTISKIPKDLMSREIDAMVREQLNESIALYSLNIPLLKALKPDLLVTQALCDVCAVSDAEVQKAARELSSQPQVINLEPMSMQDVFKTILLIGDASQAASEARLLVSNLQSRIQTVIQRSRNIPKDSRPRVAFLEWLDPPFNAGHWTPELIEMAGGRDCLGNKHKPSRTIDWEELENADPDILVLGLCGFDLERSLVDIGQILPLHLPKLASLYSQGNILLFDGNAYFSRSGPRLVDSLEILAHALFPDIHPLPSGLPAAVKIKR